ncbi:serine/threonine-protein phosphatase 6 regulatory ankyrin repeat subunit C-like [Triticum dicoccoides]|uniref:serine/threonine-protein phosphatase 6 regulatory ankyrin repeat subunit C-like n=1 Tax=Triticum dicoccoides TaxID=85692 RepID=UPI0018909DB4|nr:serine/threonine-protein phosphatase 6 regulatory ankyrin repeat subunit C-like [Triticum dicoccoides]
MDRRLLEAATSGDSKSMKDMASRDASILLRTTPQGNTCLHISSTHGHEGFCQDVLVLNQTLLSKVNSDRETPLIAAVMGGHASLASVLLGRCCMLGLSEVILQTDNDRCNALHHAINYNHKDLAMELIIAKPSLSHGVNKYVESPMFMAAMRDFTDIVEKLLDTHDSAHEGTYGHNALHAAARNGNAVIAKTIMATRPLLATEKSNDSKTPVHIAVIMDKIEVLRIFLEHDWSLGHVTHKEEYVSSLLFTAACRGNVGIARELLKHCPDAPYRLESGKTCLHVAVEGGHTEFVQFLLKEAQLQKLVNMRDGNGKTALHHAVNRCNPKIVAALLSRKETNFTIYDNHGESVIWQLRNATDHAKTLNWEWPRRDMLQPEGKSGLLHLLKQGRGMVVVCEQGKTPTVMKWQCLYPMCSSLSVAFVCIIAKWEDTEFLIYYQSFTKKLMWFAYIATTTAFATGLYTVLAPRLHWLAIGICSLPVLLPVLTKVLGEWPVLKLRFRLGKSFKSDLLDMV